MTNNKDKWLRALQAKGIRTPQDEVGRAGRHRHDDPEANPPKDRAGFRPVRGRSAKPFKATGHKAESAGRVHDADYFGEVVI